MRFRIGVVVFLALAGAADGASAPGEDVVRRVLTVRVDARTGKLVRAPAERFTRPVAARLVSPRPVPERVVEARGVTSEAAPAAAVSGGSFEEFVAQVAREYEIRPSFVHAVIKTESNYNPHAISRKGALGLMQLMPHTARRFGVKNAFNPEENVKGGVRYLRHLLDLYDDPRLSLAAYNAGEGAVERFRGVPPYSETRQFVQRVNRYYSQYSAQDRVLGPQIPEKKLEGPRIYQHTDASGRLRYTTSSP